ncbi:MAG: hypothetical protein RSD90_02905 [Anaerovoracaceae bacterium]
MKIGIGFATGRKNFQKVLRTNIYNWKEDNLTDKDQATLHLFVAYDLDYNNTKRGDYTNISSDLQRELESCTFICKNSMQTEIESLINDGVIDSEEAKLLFRKGYAAKRNMILYYAIKNKMDCLIFLDDDEYPMAVTNNNKSAIWGGQHVISTHLRNISYADITNGYHCGYVSPIPHIEFNEKLKEEQFKDFIEAISNDIINWDKLKGIMENGGVTYAEVPVLVSKVISEVAEVKGAKFISGANLCINLKDCTRIFPFYNPPGARGEDTFLSTCLTDRKVLRVPTYTFHDGFLTYRHLLEGILPTKLSFINADTPQIKMRFYKACVGWIRYKPLLVYITEPDDFEEKMVDIRAKLVNILPCLADFFQMEEFNHILVEFDKYRKNVVKHYADFQKTQESWAKLMEHLDRA